MTTLRIWAPAATSVDVVVGSRRHPCSTDTSGWWKTDDVHVGDDYLVSLDGGPGHPDPRSPWQPNGVHGPSRLIDPSSERAPLPASFRHVPLSEAVIYELHVGTFTRQGTLVAAAEELSHLVNLGVTHVELMPIAQWSGTHGWGYDGVDLYAPHQGYGGPSALHYFIRNCHEHGLGVLIDVVHNHFGPDGAYHDQLGPYRTSAYQTPWGDAVNLDGAHSQEVRRFLIDSALQWLRDYGADGLRLDALHSLCDSSERHFVAELVDEVRALEKDLGRPFLLIGEYDDHDPRAVASRSENGWGLDAHWNDDFHHALHSLLTGERSSYYIDFGGPQTLAKVLQDGYALNGGFSTFRNAEHGKPFGPRTRDHLVAYIQSHDQIGNRALGERFHQLAGIDKAKIAAAILMVSPFVPMIFQGEEWAASTPFLYFCDFESEELRKAVREGRKREFAGWTSEPPDPIDPQTRAMCVLAWDELGEPAHADMLAWYRALIALRKEYPELRDPRPDSIRVTQTASEIRIERGPFTLLVNCGNEPRPVGVGNILMTSKRFDAADQLPPRACALILRTTAARSGDTANAA